MSDIRESIEKYNRAASEQPGEGWPDALPISSFTMEERAAALEKLLKRAEAIIGGRGGPSMRERVQFILKRARTHNLSADLYGLAWFIEQTLPGEHVIIDQRANPANAGFLP